MDMTSEEGMVKLTTLVIPPAMMPVEDQLKVSDFIMGFIVDHFNNTMGVSTKDSFTQMLADKLKIEYPTFNLLYMK
jgi:hypothetical protein